ncbi:hypothetical protein KXW47_008706, partial [Aspergillus fumigatus]
MNYHYPPEGVQDHGLKFDQDLLRTLHEDVAEWDPDEYLPQVTYNWVTRQLEEMNFNPMAPVHLLNGVVFTPQREVYMGL